MTSMYYKGYEAIIEFNWDDGSFHGEVLNLRDVITFEGPGMESVILEPIKEGLDSTPGVTATRGMAWIVEGKLGYMMDPAFKGKDPGAFKLYAVPLPKN